MHSRAPADANAAPHQDGYHVVSIPATDDLFRHTVDRHVRSVRQQGATLRSARRSLRQRYPDAELSCQRDGGIRGESVELWFAYRDGRAEAIAPPSHWWDDRGLARVVIDPSGRLIGANAPCRRLLGLPPANGGVIMLRDLVSGELYQDLRLESRGLPPGHDWVGSLPIRLPDGRRLDVEFHVRRERTAERFEVTLRSLGDRDRANDWIALQQSTLRSVPPALLTELFRSGVRRKLGAGERLAKSLISDEWVVLVTAGVMRLYVAMDGFEPTLAYGNRGSLFGTHAMVPSEAFLVGLQSVTPSVVLQLAARRVGELAKSNPAFARALSEDVQLHLHEVVRSFAAHAAGNLRQRLARQIVELSDLEPEDELVPVTEQQLADGVGSIRESIGRSIGDLRRDGSIATTRHGLLVLDKGRLREAGHAGMD
ncbi:MAG: family transcriptional regulator, cyclic receptor protein [Chloroflexota bacterium]|nr:family transcriptional regulator, cyclic receptor protein [Chloroflexota bacterium]